MVVQPKTSNILAKFGIGFIRMAVFLAIIMGAVRLLRTSSLSPVLAVVIVALSGGTFYWKRAEPRSIPLIAGEGVGITLTFAFWGWYLHLLLVAMIVCVAGWGVLLLRAKINRNDHYNQIGGV